MSSSNGSMYFHQLDFIKRPEMLIEILTVPAQKPVLIFTYIHLKIKKL
jgi:hypothetical protein